MKSSFRLKLLLSAGATALAFALVIGVNAVISQQHSARLIDVEQRLVPKLELGPELGTQFDQLRRSLQDAVAAQDAEALSLTKTRKERFLQTLESARGLVDPNQAAALRTAVEDYYQAAFDVSRRLVARETG